MSGWLLTRAAVLACMAWLFTPAAAAQTEVKSTVWRQVIEQYVERQNLSAGLRTSVEVAPDEPGPPACQRSPRMADSSRTRWLGPLTIVLQCDQPAWRWSVNVRVRGMAQVVQAGRSLPNGQLLRTEDLRLVDADIATEPLGVLTDLAQAADQGRRQFGTKRFAAGNRHQSRRSRDGPVDRSGLPSLC